MKKVFLRLIKIIAGLVLAVVVLAVGIVLLFHTDFVQQRLLNEYVALLKDKLQTEVSVESVGISLFGEDVELNGVVVEDLQHRKMFELEKLGVEIDLWRLLNNELRVTDATIKGLKANLYQSSPDSAANFQFVIDAFKKKKTVKKDSIPADSVKKKKLIVDVDKIWLERIHARFNDKHAELGSLLFKKGPNDRIIAEIRNLKSAWVAKTKKGPVDNKLSIGVLDIMDMKDCKMVSIDDLCWKTNNHKPRKNSGKPKRGFFDAGHFDIVAHLRAKVDYLAKDSIVAVITECTALDTISGIDIRQLKTRIEANKQVAHLKKFVVSLPNTTLKIDDVTLQLPSKKQGRKLAYQTSLITGSTLLKDISRPFAPVLKGVTEPLFLETRMDGNDEGMNFHDVKVYTKKKDLMVNATGFIRGLKDKYKLQVHFDVQRMVAQRGSKERLISQFPVKKFMMKQLHNLGRIVYTGSFDVLWKREQFQGLLSTETGNINFVFGLDEKNKYVEGTVRTDSFELGKAMGMPDLKKVACKATFKFDISKPRTAIMRRKVGGKLPMGEVNAEVYDAKYKILHVRNTVVTIKSNGAIAEGEVNVRGKHMDMLCSFSFTNTNEMQKMKIKPRLKFHGASEEDKAAEEARIQQRKQERAERKAARQAEKDARAIEKAARRAEKDSLKAIKKAEKSAKKAAKKAAKEAEKAAKAAAKAAKNSD